MFLMLSALLGIKVDASNRELKIVNPHLPDFLGQLAIDGLQVGASRVLARVPAQWAKNVLQCDPA